MKVFTRLVGVCFLCLVSLVSAMAQEPLPSSKWRVSKVEITGLSTTSHAEALGIAKLEIGQIIDLEEVKQASQRLGKSDLFSRVGFSYRYSGDLIEVTFDVSERKGQKLQVVFDNFVWFTDQEIHEALKLKLPDFDGTAAQNELVLSKIAQALTEQLRQKKITGDVTHEIREDLSANRGNLVFSVKTSDLEICAIDLPGATPELLPVLNKEMEQLLKTSYSRLDVVGFSRAALAPLYRERGYLKVKLPDVRAQFGTDGSCKNEVVVAVQVEEGIQYKWKGAAWSGNQALGNPELDKAMAMQPGAVANEVLIRGGFRNVAQAYGKKGYIKAQIKQSPRFDDNARTVEFQATIEEGAQYRMGQLLITGLTEAETKALYDRWSLKSGDILDASYAGSFIQLAMRDGKIGKTPGAKEYSLSTRPDASTLTADVLITLK